MGMVIWLIKVRINILDKMKKNFPIYLIGLLLCSCHSNNPTVTFKEDEAYISAFDSIECPSSVLNPEYFFHYNGNFWVLDNSNPSGILHIINPKGELILSGLGEGNGPDEVLEATSIRVINGNIFIYDSPKGNVSQISIEDSVFKLDVIADNIRLMDDAIILKNNSLLLLPVGRNCSYYIQDAESGNNIDSLSYFPPAPKGIQNEIHSLACTGTFEIMDNYLYAARILSYDGGIDFFHIGDDKISHIGRVTNFEMEYSVNDQGMPIPNNNTKVGYASITSSKNMFYATFSEEMALKNTVGESNEIHQFSETGEPLRKYILDRNVMSIFISQNNDYLYAISCSNSETCKIYIYRISGNI